MMSEEDQKFSICFVANFAYGAMAGGSFGRIGGVERQTSLMARWFASRGYPVSMLTWDEGQADGVEIDGVRVFKMCRRDAGLRGLRFFWPRWTRLNAAMRRADADIYYQNCGEYVTGQVAIWCRRNGRKFVYSVASDPDCDPSLPKMHSSRERVLYRYGLKHADNVIVQTRRQQGILQEGFGRDSVVIPMPCPGPSEDNYQSGPALPTDSHRILWIGRICEGKCPDRLLEIAAQCPDLIFDLVGPVGGSAYSRSVVERAGSIPNLTVHGPVPRDRVSPFYKNATVMCCTSDFEGFPNTFLEAWSHGLPIVSTFDPDNLIASHGLGVLAEDVPGLAKGIRELVGWPERWRQASRNARQYYLQNHTAEAVMPQFEKVFVDVF